MVVSDPSFVEQLWYPRDVSASRSNVPTEPPTEPRPPGLLGRLGEVRAAREPLRLLLRTPKLRWKTNNPTTVIVVPGFRSNDLATLPIRSYLSRIGHDARGWELGVVGKDLLACRDSFIEVVERVVTEVGRPVALVGWSLGGVVARETARERPDLVSQVITYGSPFSGPRFTGAASVFESEEIDEIEDLIADAESRPLKRPITAIYSRRDGIVDWRTALDTRSDQAENLEVSSSHIGLGQDPDVWEIVARKLETFDLEA